jgi:predicted porin
VKKKIIATLVGGLAALPAFGQSSVTLYGIIDDGITYNSNSGGHPVYAMRSGVISGTQWGLQGSEDLGGGLKAIFQLENGFDNNTGALGQGGLLFGRQAYMGLSSAKLGTMTIGRQYNIQTRDIITGFAASGPWTPYAAHPGDYDNLNNNYRLNNTIRYVSPNFWGFKLAAMYGLGGVAGDFYRNGIWALGGRYDGGPFTVAASYSVVHNPNLTLYGSSGGNQTGTVSNSAFPVFSGYASAQSLNILAAAAAYRIGDLTLDFIYTNTQYQDLGDTTSGPNPARYARGSKAVLNNYEVNAKYFVTPSLLIGATYDYTHGSSLLGRDAARYNMFVLGADYFLSKRTDVYLVGILQKAYGTDSTGKAATASLNSLTASNSDSQAAVRLGLRVKF